jgi:hypothetical protein
MFVPVPEKTEEQLRIEAENQALLEEFLKTLNMAVCSCGNLMEVEKGTVNYSQKDEFGH